MKAMALDGKLWGFFINQNLFVWIQCTFHCLFDLLLLPSFSFYLGIPYWIFSSGSYSVFLWVLGLYLSWSITNNFSNFFQTPWMQVSKSRPLLLTFTPQVFTEAIGMGMWVLPISIRCSFLFWLIKKKKEKEKRKKERVLRWSLSVLAYLHYYQSLPDSFPLSSF